ncbi:hypothetical protein B9Z55_003197 [Caenorhabditis nigoni]|uniref:Uncharacterized protein n=1 Tax=Caenorhabditis nigoni TaxID=1611254 RepID=A0A2G5VNX9_9PELO|nr:hypothetical protein B9Z55_003197 [Caenorhabditis nigoni]
MKEHSNAAKMNTKYTTPMAQQWLEHLSKPIDYTELREEWKAKGRDPHELEEKIKGWEKERQEEKSKEEQEK